MKIFYWIILILVYVIIDNAYAIGWAQFSNKLIQKQYDTVYKKIDSIPESQSWKAIVKIEQLFGQYEEYLTRMDNALQRKDNKTYKSLSFSSRKTLLALNREIRITSSKTNIIKTSQWNNSVSFSNNTGSGFLQKEVTYYADMFEWRNTANGDVFSQENFSAAICDTPLWSLIQVRANNKSILVEANDRPNCNKYPNVVDLSTRAFSSLSSLSAWRIKWAEAKLITTNLPPGYKKKYLKTDTFSELGIVLDSNLPNTYFLTDRVRFSWKVINTQESMLLYVRFPSGKTETIAYRIDSNKRFIVDFLPSEEGIYTFVLAGWVWFETTLSDVFYVIKNDTLKSIWYQTDSAVNLWFSSLWIEHKDSYDWKKNVQLSLPGNHFYITTIEQWMNKVTRSWVGGVTFSSNDIMRFSPGLANIQIESFWLSTPFTHDISSSEGVVYKNSALQLVPGYSSEGSDKVSVLISSKTANYSFYIPSNTSVQCSFFVTEPTWDVKKYSFPNSACRDDGYLLSWVRIEWNFPMEYEGVYLFEMVDNYGKAYVNKSLHRGAVLPLLLSNRDKVSTDIRSNVNQVRSEGVTALNSFRKSLGRNTLEIDSILTNLAQKKAEDMAKFNYVWHADSQNLYIRDSAKRFNIDISKTTSLWENVAGWSVGDLYLYEELLLSGTHRFNILRSDWKKVWIWMALSNGKVYYVQLFSD